MYGNQLSFPCVRASKLLGRVRILNVLLSLFNNLFSISDYFTLMKTFRAHYLLRTNYELISSLNLQRNTTAIFVQKKCPSVKYYILFNQDTYNFMARIDNLGSLCSVLNKFKVFRRKEDAIKVQKIKLIATYLQVMN